MNIYWLTDKLIISWTFWKNLRKKYVKLKGLSNKLIRNISYVYKAKDQLWSLIVKNFKTSQNFDIKRQLIKNTLFIFDSFISYFKPIFIFNS